MPAHALEYQDTPAHQHTPARQHTPSCQHTQQRTPSCQHTSTHAGTYQQSSIHTIMRAHTQHTYQLHKQIFMEQFHRCKGRTPGEIFSLVMPDTQQINSLMLVTGLRTEASDDHVLRIQASLYRGRLCACLLTWACMGSAEFRK